MGSNDMPELGSKISLISKADIRYEGKLFTVDPQECTIALASVRSFGTEDRPTDTPVPAQTQVYEYILFRATDIKDISVVPPNPPVIYDPAILQLSAPPASIPSSGSRFSNNSGNVLAQSMLGQLVGRERSSGGFNPMQSGFNPPQIHRPLQAPSQPSLQNPLSGGLGDFGKLDSDNRRSVTPGVLRKDSPPRSPPRRNARQQPVGARQRPSSENRIERPERIERTDRIDRQERHDRGHRMDMRSNGPQAPIGGQRYQGGMGMSKGPMERGGGSRQPWSRGHPMQNRGMTRPRPLFANRGKTPTKPLKFDSDYDFDKANHEFEELRQSLTVQLKVSDPPVPPPAPADDKKDDSGNETAVGECEEEGIPIAYDKAKSFFDNISCEALERSKGRSQRTDWRKERQLNSETFGVAMSNRRYYYNNQRGGRGYYKGGGNQHWGQYRAPRQQNNIVAKA